MTPIIIWFLIVFYFTKSGECRGGDSLTKRLTKSIRLDVVRN